MRMLAYGTSTKAQEEYSMMVESIAQKLMLR
jgi:hypothetical protein